MLILGHSLFHLGKILDRGDFEEGELLDVINKRLIEEGREPVSHLSNTFIKETDIKALIFLLEKELQNSTEYPTKTELILSEYYNTIIKKIRDKRECVTDGSISPNGYNR